MVDSNDLLEGGNMRQAVRRALGGSAVLGALAAGLVAASAPAQAAPATTTGYDSCPYGKVCLYEGWNGTGQRWDVPGCFNNAVPQWMINLGVSSVKTSGNAVWLTIARDMTLGHVGAWTGTNLSSVENDKVISVNVRC
jgi:hypothetical protein